MQRIPPAMILFALVLSLALAAGCTQETPTTGSLEITSTPAGREVQVILDGNYRGVTPLLVTNLSEGYHLIQLLSPGYAERVEVVTIAAGQQMHLSADYPPIPTPTPVTPTPLPTEPTTVPTTKPTDLPETPLEPGALYITSFPSGATIYVDGKGYGVTPRLIPDLAPGSHEIRLSLVGWKDYKVVISISPGQTFKENGVLRS
jgi:hypothetical protein